MFRAHVRPFRGRMADNANHGNTYKGIDTMNAHTPAPLTIGQAVYWQNKGWIAHILDGRSNVFTIGGNGLESAGRDLQIVWDNGTTSQVSESIARDWINRASMYEMPIINDAPERYQEALQAENVAREARIADQNAARDAAKAWQQEHAAKIPDLAKAVIVAEFHRDDCDTMTDYFNTKRERTIILGFSTHTRDLFAEMRKMALNHPETAFLHDAPKDAEHRNKYSMGDGYFLSEAGSYRTGWRILKQKFWQMDKRADYLPVGAWAVPESAPFGSSKKASAPKARVQSATVGAVSIEQHTHTKKGFEMWIVILAERVERAAYDAMLADARALGGWYSRAWQGAPAGFAFKSQENAEQFAGSLGDRAPNNAATDDTSKAGIADKLRAIADNMQADIDHKNADRRENTPKQRRQAQEARNDARHLERAQKGLRALALAHEAGTVPDALRNVATKKAALSLAESKIDRSNCGYYDAGHDTGKPYRDTPEALAFWAMLTPQTPEQKRADAIKRAESDLKNCKIEGFFPTPKPIIARMIDHAGTLDGLDILEPSAGSGAILDAIKEVAPSANVTACEVSPRLRDLLTLKGHALAGWDFTEFETDQRFDRVLMNPPFERGQDMEHVRRAFDMLADGGRLVAIMSPHFTFASNAKAQGFRGWLAGHVSEVYEIEAGAFKESGTGVASCLVIIEKEG